MKNTDIIKKDAEVIHTSKEEQIDIYLNIDALNKEALFLDKTYFIGTIPANKAVTVNLHVNHNNEYQKTDLLLSQSRMVV